MKCIRIKFQLLLVVFSFICLISFSQESAKDKGRILKFSYVTSVGKFVARVPLTEPLDKTPYITNELLIGFQTTGKKYWHNALNYPNYGIGLYSGKYLENYKGSLWGSFLYIDLPIIAKEKQTFKLSLGLGGVLHCNSYDIKNNPDFMLTSSYANVYSHITIGYNYSFNKHLDMGLGVTFQHFSNGGWQYPNPGMEMLSGQLTVAYTPKEYTPIKKIAQNPTHEREKWTICYVAGVNGSSTNYSTKYFNTTFSASYSPIRKPCYDFGIGLDITYNGHLIEQFSTTDEIPNRYLMNNGIFISNELIAGKCRLGFQIGTRIYSKIEYDLPIYERITLRYQFIKKSFLHFGIKLNGGKSEFLEWGIGMRL